MPHQARSSLLYRFGPHPDDVYYHRHLIYDLSLLGDPAGLDKYNYPNLHKLTIDCAKNKDPGRERGVSLELTEMFPLLVHLTLNSVKITTTSWLGLSAHCHIRTLQLYCVWIEADDTPAFWRACEKLESLELRKTTIAGGCAPDEVVFERMRKLIVIETEHLNIAAQLELFLRCPKLVEVKWGIGEYEDDEQPTLITHPLPSGYWPHLDKLSIDCNLQDIDLASLLEGVGEGQGNIVNLQLVGCTLRRQAFKALDLHFHVLVDLDLEDCYSAESYAFRDILCCCSRLENLRARSVLANDIVEGGPWVCQQLRELKICFLFDQEEQDLQQLVFERLSTLVRLERLIMHYPLYDVYEHYHVLEFQLERGLIQLACLKQLTTLDFVVFSSPYIPQLGTEEVAWMGFNWKKLTRVSGMLNKDPQECTRLKNALELFKITTA
ncbi:hypothetical protein BGZ65_003607 [Modicella reniformis]|uniref:Uncharacterized protein n=1 Tax=Modicella reniformis TaxID=1440133 RepID=A0A9P6M987_9FUNG|nr:hypothetical protein BGZ65_003607 [Modicella reniformis]